MKLIFTIRILVNPPPPPIIKFYEMLFNGSYVYADVKLVGVFLQMLAVLLMMDFSPFSSGSAIYVLLFSI